MSYKVTVIAGGPLSGPHLKDRFIPGQTYPFPSSDKAYVEGVLMNEGRLEVTEIPDPEPAPAEPDADAEAKAKEAADAKSKADAEAAAKPKGGK